MGFAFADFEEFEPKGTKSLTLAIQRQFFMKDLYYVSNAITSRRAFFGRAALVTELVSTLRSGNSHIALFGLRKMGKTSILYRIIEELREYSSVLHVHIDLQRIDAIRATAGHFLWALAEQLHAGHEDIRRVDGLRLLGRYSRFPEQLSEDQIFEDFDYDLRLLFRSTSKRLLFVLDEIELMSPDTHGSEWGNGYVRVWRFLRGLDQTSPGRLRFLIAGTNPRCIESNALGGRENPTYNFFTKYFLAPLNEVESAELLTTLGDRMGLKWEIGAKRRAHSLIGGHPFLLRLLGSAMHRARTARDSEQIINEADLNRIVPEYVGSISSSLSQMVEVLGEHYRDELHLLETLAAGKIGEFTELAREFPDDVAHLVGYGLISEPYGSPALSVEVLQSWLQNRMKVRSGSKNSRAHDSFEQGAVLDDFRVDQILGLPGGFGTVYRAEWLSRKETIALKILRSASLERLQREVDILNAVSHPSIVKVFDYGQLSTGEVYIAMQYLPGQPLRHHCTRATRLNEQLAEQILRDLLAALSALHPNEEKVSKLKKLPTLTTAEYSELQIAMHGYVHRDIKPENVVIVNGYRPVLIDFGISVRVSTDVRTVSATAGYLPPDGLDAKWNPDVDLYQLGITLAQAMCGVDIQSSTYEELRRMLSVDCPSHLGKMVAKLCAPKREQRFNSAQSALAALSR